ncbi:protoheme IX farnesyltransferase [Halogeometricum borinquense DSM 11551]|uniref:Protoheme IX farnesyltransferase n=2 Tax=Halogeometricum borinquense (strain ATCC 700274 / DSM 11551 / JCM 10706 / KCTC 4070 / PR3) TaxID=469382 RepID=E4NQ09_HALBP|nr:heme o synthase [Halogeometricum borinquense]ADQ67754.1 protoheme IX farnesyltransferase [Halogeometricum borinquense DSM 11551]
MGSNRTHDRFHALLAATAMGVYLLLLVGATTALTDAAAACTAWPVCGDGFTAPTTAAGWLAVGHRLAAVLVGLLGVVTLVMAVRSGVERRVLGSMVVAGVLYPVQAALGAFVAVGGADATLSTLHLVVGMGIFGSLVLALAWVLETETGDPTDEPQGVPEPDLPPEGEHDPTIPTDPFERAKATAAAYFRLMKPRLMWLLCLVASAGMALAATTSTGLTPEIVLATLGGGVLSIGASGTFNHVLERDIDRRMERTSDRPLAVDLVPVRHAVAFGLVLAAASVALFAWVNTLAAVLGVGAILFYSVVYTLILKPNTVQNTVIGGAAGALPALIGWVAVTGEIGFGGLLLAAVIFLWTPAHFYNLALAYKDDYARGGFPMMPVVRGETETRKHTLWYLGATLIAAGALAAMEALGVVYALTSVVFGAVFLYFVVQLHYEQTESAAFRAFHASNAYLGMLLLAVVVDTLAV